MTNQPDIVQPRIRRTNKNGNTPAVLAEQSTRVLIRVPRLATSAIAAQTAPPPLTQPHSNKPPVSQSQSIQPLSIHPSPQAAKPLPAPVAAQPAHYSTTTERLQGSTITDRPTALPSSPSVQRAAARIDAAHSASTGPHRAAPDWLNDRSRKTNTVMQTRLLLVVGAIAGFALGALTWRSHGTHVPPSQNSASRMQAPSQGALEKPRSAVNVTDAAAAAESNAPAQIAQAVAETKPSKETNLSTWQWNPKGAANEPASIGHDNDRISETEPADTSGTTTPSDVQAGDPSRAAWLQGTIDNVHSTSAPVQR